VTAAPGSDEGAIRHCRTCGVDVSVPAAAAAPACPRCGGPLELPSDAAGDAQDRTLHDLAPRDAVEATEVAAAPDTARGPAASGDHLVETASDPELPGGASRPPPAEAPVLRRLGEYELRRVLGKGGMGVVYEAYQPALERTVALKVMSDAEAGEEELARFSREARAAAKLTHDNIVPIYDVGEADGRRYFTMELVAGRTLLTLARSGELEPLEGARLVAKVARAIQFAHDRGIIHRDLKPSNIIVDDRGEPHVMDFGLAKDLSDVSALTMTGIAMGSPPYMPPEQARGDFREVDEVSDVYALGAVLYECLVGEPPFRGKSLYDVIAKVLVEEPRPPRRSRPEVPTDLETICLKALEKEKWRRYPSALELADDLERTADGRSIRAVRQRGLATRVARVVERHRLHVASALVPVVTLLALLAYGFGGGGAPSADAEPAARPEPAEPIAGAALLLARGQTEHALTELLEAIPPERLPRGATVREVKPVGLDEASGSDLRRRIVTELGADGERRLDAELLDQFLNAAIIDPDVGPATLSALVRGWLAEVDPALVELVRRTTLAVRAAKRREVAVYRLALDGSPTPLDAAILRDAVVVLGGEDVDLEPLVAGRPDLRPALARAPPLLTRDGYVVGADDDPWRFPPFVVDTSSGLFGPGSAPWRAPTQPLVAEGGALVVVGWLRFLYVLRGDDGVVLARRRLPGLAAGLDYDPGGAFRIRLGAPGSAADEPLVVAATLTPGDPPALDLAWPDGRPVRGVDLIPAGEVVARDELRRIATARLPEFDDLLVVHALDEDADRVEAARRIDLPLPGGRVVAREQWFRQEGPTPCLGRRLWTRPGGLASGLSGEVTLARVWLHRPPVVGPERALTEEEVRAGADRRGAVHLQLFVETGFGESRYLVWPLYYRELDEGEWLDVRDRAEDLLAGAVDPNPWVQAFAAVARQRCGLPAGGLAAAAAASPHLSPGERVELACFLDRWDARPDAGGSLAPAADAALGRALRDLLADCAYAPAWAGYGARLGPGRALATRVEELRRAGRAARAARLAAWRDAFAPVLADGPVDPAEVADADPDTPEPPPALAAPPAGIGGLDAATLLRTDAATRLQEVAFLYVIGGLLALLFLRYRRHALRDLARLGAGDGPSRLRLWADRPRARVAFLWFTYLTWSDKLALGLALGAFLGAFAVMDASVDAVARIASAPAGLRTGLPAERAAWRRVEALAAPPAPDDEERAPPSADAEVAYARAWLRQARGEPIERVRDAYQAALAAAPGDPRVRLGLAELLVEAGDRDRARTQLERAAEVDPAFPGLQLLAAELDGAEPAAASDDPRIALALAVTGARPRPLAPPPALEVRDEAVLGRARWSGALGRFLLRNLLPVRGQADDALERFERTFVAPSPLEAARLRNPWMWAVPAAVLVLLVTAFFRPWRRFEPLESDLDPPAGIRLLGPLIPGVSQLMTGRTVRGFALLLPALYLLFTLGQELALGGHGQQLAPWLERWVPAAELSGAAGTSLRGYRAAQAAHTSELFGVLVVLYVLHWVDLALTQRRLLRGRPAERAESTTGGRLVVPVESLLGSDSALPATGARRSRDPDEGTVGPFDATELGGETEQGGADDPGPAP